MRSSARHPHGERRACERRSAAACAWLTSARLRTGLEVAIVDLAPGGALVEATSRLLPGANVELHLGAPGWRWSAPARVLRCRVSALVAEQGVRYRAALRFDRSLEPPHEESGWRGTDPIAPRPHERAVTPLVTSSSYPSPGEDGGDWEAATRGDPAVVPWRPRLGGDHAKRESLGSGTSSGRQRGDG